MNITEAILSRRSIRRYQEGAVIPEDHIEKMLTAAMMAPSACNSRPWKFLVVRNREKLDAIRAVHPYTGMLRTASLAIVILADPSKQVGTSDGYFQQDCGAATQNILLQALELGYGTCWCGVYPKEDRINEVTEILDISDGLIPFNVIAVGVPNEAPEARGKYEAERVRYID